MRIAVIGGGENCEHDVSLASAASVRSVLESQHDVIELTIERDGSWRDARGPLPLAAAVNAIQACDVAFPVVHGPRGEDGSLAALLSFAHVPYVGSGVRTGAIAMDKWTTKLVAEAVGVRTAPEAAPGEFPAVVKPVSAGSSFGVARVENEAELASAVDAARTLDDRVLVESYVGGREIDIAVLTRSDGSRVLSAALEVVVPGDLFDTTVKYDGSAEFRVPASLSRSELDELHRQALAVHDALGCAGVARIDFFLTENGFVLGEVNTMPGLTAQSQVPRMFDAVGMPYPALLNELVTSAIPVPA